MPLLYKHNKPHNLMSDPTSTTVPWIGLWCAIVVFPDHIHLLFSTMYSHAKWFYRWNIV